MKPAPDQRFKSQEEYYRWNDEMVRRYDPALFYKTGFVRVVEGARFRHILKNVRRYGQGGRFLEVGCGPGFMIQKVLDSGLFSTCLGLDISLPSLQKARERAASARLLAGDGAFLPLVSESMSVICFTEVIEHVPDPVAILKEAGRVLRPGGVVVVTAPNESLITLVKRVILALRLDLLLFGRGYRPALRMDEEWHLHALDKRALEDILERAGLQALRWTRLPFNLVPLRHLVVCRPREAGSPS